MRGYVKLILLGYLPDRCEAYSFALFRKDSRNIPYSVVIIQEIETDLRAFSRSDKIGSHNFLLRLGLDPNVSGRHNKAYAVFCHIAGNVITVGQIADGNFGYYVSVYCRRFYIDPVSGYIGAYRIIIVYRAVFIDKMHNGIGI